MKRLCSEHLTKNQVLEDPEDPFYNRSRGISTPDLEKTRRVLDTERERRPNLAEVRRPLAPSDRGCIGPDLPMSMSAWALTRMDPPSLTGSDPLDAQLFGTIPKNVSLGLWV